MKKPFYKSKTFWFNVAVAGHYVTKQVLGVAAIPDPDPTMVALINLVLRAVTRQPIGIR